MRAPPNTGEVWGSTASKLTVLVLSASAKEITTLTLTTAFANISLSKEEIIVLGGLPNWYRRIA